MKTATIVLATVLMFLAPGLAQAITVDGNLSDWGVTPGVWSGPSGSRVNSSDWVPFAGIQGVDVQATGEDYDPINGASGQVYPGWGGQNFDAEAMYATFNSTTFYYAIVTGHPIDGTQGHFPGDIALDFGSGYTYGIETMNTRGLTFGDLYSVTTWNEDPYWFPKSVTTIAAINGTEAVGDGNMVYDNDDYGAGNGDHWVIEGSMPISAFGTDFAWGKPFTMSWTQTCGNDVIRLNVTPTPEPATMALFGLGLGGLAFFRRKQEKEIA
jgi:hypothetical protein